jgi:hypothetical protein
LEKAKLTAHFTNLMRTGGARTGHGPMLCFIEYSRRKIWRKIGEKFGEKLAFLT